MSAADKWNVLYIGDDRSAFDAQTPMFKALFGNVDIAMGREETLKFFEENRYDIVIGDLSVSPEAVGVLKQLKDIRKEQTIFAMVSPEDTDKLYGIADLGIHAFELTPEHFDLALEEIAKFNPHA